MIYGILPFLAIPVLSYVLYRFSADSKASKERIKQFESQDSYQQKLATVFQKLEREFESAAVRTVDSPEGESYPIIKSNLHPVVTPTQKRMVEWLNQLPFQKHLAFFPGVRNSHGMIICRDSHRFDQHKRGESVVRHWADHFVFWLLSCLFKGDTAYNDVTWPIGRSISLSITIFILQFTSNTYII